MQFHIDNQSIANITPSKVKTSLNLYDQLFITTLTVNFHYRATIKKTFYIFSSQSFSVDTLQEYGINTLKVLNRNNVIILPQNKEIEEWINSELKISSIPEFPDAVIIDPEKQYENAFISGEEVIIDG